MKDDASRWCALLPCGGGLNLAVPQNCLAEIVTVHTARERPPEKIRWRDQPLPVVDFALEESTGWRDERSGAGLLAIFRGLQGEGCDYWAIAVRGQGMTVKDVSAEDVSDEPSEVLELATAAFSLDGTIYQVPDLTGLQRKIAASLEAA